jgi:hypothetical protein
MSLRLLGLRRRLSTLFAGLGRPAHMLIRLSPQTCCGHRLSAPGLGNAASRTRERPCEPSDASEGKLGTNNRRRTHERRASTAEWLETATRAENPRPGIS